MRYDGFVALNFQFSFLRMRYRAEGRKTIKILPLSTNLHIDISDAHYFSLVYTIVSDAIVYAGPFLQPPPYAVGRNEPDRTSLNGTR